MRLSAYKQVHIISIMSNRNSLHFYHHGLKSKGYTNTAHLANLVEREESRSLYLSTFELIKTLLASIFQHPSLTLARSVTSCSQGLSSFSREDPGN